MKQNWKYYTLVIFLAFSLFVIGCSDDGDDGTGPSKNDFLGKWRLMKVTEVDEYGFETISFQNGFLYTDGGQSSMQFQVLVYFYDGGTGMRNYRYYDPEWMEEWEEVSGPFTWQISGNKIKLIVEYEDGENSENIYEYQLNGDVLRLKIEYEDGERDSGYSIGEYKRE
jgi:hypothetical protein